ncbi:MAG: hypothetical protein P8017_05805 [Deltaproteobacteria bacterium]
MTLDQIKPIDILLVEGNLGDARFAWNTLKEAKARNKLNQVENGVEALAFLHHRNRHFGGNY